MSIDASNTRLVQVNGHPAVQMPLRIRAGAWGWSRSAFGKSPAPAVFQSLMGILEGRAVLATAFSGTNVCGYTSEAQLRAAYAAMDDHKRTWIKDRHLEEVIAQFGKGDLGFEMSGLYCEESPLAIQEAIDRAKALANDSQATFAPQADQSEIESPSL